MTLCIAAACAESEGAGIVVSSDWKTQVGDFAAAEIQNKLYWLFSGSWCVLIAGTVSSAKSLIRTIRQKIRRKQISKLNIEDELSRAVQCHRSKLVNQHIQSKHNVSFRYFLRNKAKFDQAQWAATSLEIKEIGLDCQLIVCAFIKDVPFMFQVEGNGDVWQGENFLAIGSGSTIANSILCFRRQNEDMPLNETVYNVFEATKFVRKANTPGVGKVHAFSVLLPGRRQKRLRSGGLRRLERYFEKYGPRNISRVALLKKQWEKY